MIRQAGGGIVNFEGQVALVADFAEHRQNGAPVHVPLEGQDVVVQLAGVVRYVGGLQTLAHHPQRFSLVDAHQVGVAEIPADAHIADMEGIHQIAQLYMGGAVHAARTAMGGEAVGHVLNGNAAAETIR